MLNTYFDLSFNGDNVNFLIAFIAGFITFFASCLLPLVPTYIAYLSGVALNSKEAKQEKFKIFEVALFFVFGFITTFVLMSLALSTISNFFSPIRELVQIIGGFVFIILGLFMLGVFKHRIFSQEKRLDINKIFGKKNGIEINKFFDKYKKLHAMFVGVVFGFGWTPCIGPVLAVILFWSTHAESTFNGLMLLVAYGIGLGMPFLIVALGFEKIIPLLKRYKKISLYVSYVSGALIILAGILMMSGNFHGLSLYVINLFGMNKLSV
ncbi:sulfite exporter TauE/SafE family protein [Candidatus Woesebacteria bacterium]|nr:sulfite exporter TauE/SafE family protein [Candidatus Woesebacteria bacterium]